MSPGFCACSGVLVPRPQCPLKPVVDRVLLSPAVSERHPLPRQASPSKRKLRDLHAGLLHGGLECPPQRPGHYPWSSEKGVGQPSLQLEELLSTADPGLESAGNQWR